MRLLLTLALLLLPIAGQHADPLVEENPDLDGGLLSDQNHVEAGAGEPDRDEEGTTFLLPPPSLPPSAPPSLPLRSCSPARRRTTTIRGSEIESWNSMPPRSSGSCPEAAALFFVRGGDVPIGRAEGRPALTGVPRAFAGIFGIEMDWPDTGFAPWIGSGHGEPTQPAAAAIRP